MSRGRDVAIVCIAVLMGMYLAPYVNVHAASPGAETPPAPTDVPEFANIKVWYPPGQSAAGTGDSIFLTLSAWHNDTANPIQSVRYDNRPIGGNNNNRPMYDDGQHVDGAANDSVYGGDRQETVSINPSPTGCDYVAMPIVIDAGGTHQITTSAPVVVDNAAPTLKDIKIEYPPNQQALKTGDTVRVVTNTTDSCIPSNSSVKIPIGGMMFVAADLTKIGGKPTEGMFDDGMHGDGAIGDGTYGTDEIVSLSQESAAQFEVPVIGIDIGGNRVVDRTLKVKVDNTPPVVSDVKVQYASGSTAKDGDKIKVQATVTDSGAVNGIYRVYVDASSIGGDVQAPMLGTGTYTSGDIPVATGNKVGRFKVRVVAIDIAGNRGEQEANVDIDNGNTQVKISGLVDQEIVEGTYTFRAVTQDAVQVSINIFGEDRFMAYNVTNGTWEYTVDTTAQPDDQYTVTVTAFGLFGTQATDSKTFRIDNNAPVINVKEPQAGTFVEGSLTFDATKVTISDKYLSSSEYSIDGLGWIPITQAWDTSKVDDGAHTVHFRAMDEAMHVTTAELPLIVDNNMPSATAVQVPPQASEGKYITGEWTMLFEATDKVEISSVTLTFDKGSSDEFSVQIFPVSSKYYEFTLNTSRFTDGQHNYELVVHDKAWDVADVTGEKYVSKAKHENTLAGDFKVDNTAPIITPSAEFELARQNDTLSGLVNLSFNIVDTGSGVAIVEVRIDDGKWVQVDQDVLGTYSYLWRTGKKDNGIHRIEVRATDNLGHVKVQSYKISVDNPDTSSAMIAVVAVLVFIVLMIFAFLFHRAKAKAIRETPPPPPPQTRPERKRPKGGDAE